MPNTIAAPYTKVATVARYCAEGIPRPITLNTATMVNVLAAGDTAKAVATRALELTLASLQRRHRTLLVVQRGIPSSLAVDSPTQRAGVLWPTR